MTAYQGGKKRLGLRIYNVINLIENDISNEKLAYFEPFVGMAGVLKHFAKEGNREIYASDINKDLIMLWKSIQKGWKPPLKCSKDEYDRLKTAKPSAKRAFIGIAASYGTVFFNGYRLEYNKNKNYLKEAYNGLMEMAPIIKNVDFMSSKSFDYWDPKNYLIYCDPPYFQNKLKNKFFQEFDHIEFWKIMRKWSKNNIVIISEVTAPKDFIKIWCTKSNCVTRNNNKIYEDCLFVHASIYKKLSKSVKNKIKTI